MAQKNSQEFDSGLGSDIAPVQSAKSRSLHEEFDSGLGSDIAPVQSAKNRTLHEVEEDVDKQKDRKKSGNFDSEKLISVDKVHDKHIKFIKRQMRAENNNVRKKLATKDTEVKELADKVEAMEVEVKQHKEQHATNEKNLKDVKRQFGDQMEVLRKKLAIEKENSKDVKRQLGVQIEDLHKKLAEKEAEVKELEEQITELKNQIWHLENEIENSELKEKIMSIETNLQDQEQELTSQIEQANQKCDWLEKKTVVQWKICQMLVRCTPPESGYILIMLDVYVRCAGIEYLEAYRNLREAFTEHAPERPFPEPEDLEKLRKKWAEWYDKTTPPCFIQTLCDFYGKVPSEIPYCYFGYIPGIHQNVSEEFIKKHFYIMYSLLFEERRAMSVELFEENYVICYHKLHGDGHMCAVSKPELEFMMDNDNLDLLKPKDTEFGKDIRADPRSITRFLICLPRGTSIIDPDDIGYKVKTFQFLQELHQFQFRENEYEVKVTSLKGHVGQFRVTKVNGKYVSEWRANDQDVYTKVELYLKKGISPFKNLPSLTFE